MYKAIALIGFCAVVSASTSEPAFSDALSTSQAQAQSARATDISDLPSSEAKKEVQARMVASATTLNSAHGATVDDEKVVCHREELTGSNIPGPSVCATKRAWRQKAVDAQDFTADYQNRNRAFGVPGEDSGIPKSFNNPLPGVSR